MGIASLRGILCRHIRPCLCRGVVDVNVGHDGNFGLLLIRSHGLVGRGRHATIANHLGAAKRAHGMEVSRRWNITRHYESRPMSAYEVQLVEVRGKRRGAASRKDPSAKHIQAIAQNSCRSSHKRRGLLSSRPMYVAH